MNTINPNNMNLCSEIHKELQLSINAILSSLKIANNPTLLDIGCWDGFTTSAYGRSSNASELLGVEVFEEQASIAERLGIEVARIDLEKGVFPWPDSSVDIVVCNQVFEHLKDIFNPLDQISRVLKPGGVLIISVPNLASFHNRIMLLLGMQPSSIRIFGPHVRGLSKNEFQNFLLTGGMFTCEKVDGVGFYPLPAKPLGNLLGNIWKSACHTPIWVLKRTAVLDFSYSKAYKARSEQTFM
jgi:SAM-dependent methyltransferase